MEEKKITESNYFSLVNKTVLIFIAIITAIEEFLKQQKTSRQKNINFAPLF